MFLLQTWGKSDGFILFLAYSYLPLKQMSVRGKKIVFFKALSHSLVKLLSIFNCSGFKERLERGDNEIYKNNYLNFGYANLLAQEGNW